LPKKGRLFGSVISQVDPLRIVSTDRENRVEKRYV